MAKVINYGMVIAYENLEINHLIPVIVSNILHVTYTIYASCHVNYPFSMHSY